MQSSYNPHSWSPIVWSGFVGRRLIRPCFFDGNLNEDGYLHFLLNVLPKLVENSSPDARHLMWYWQDGAPAHYGRDVRDWLAITFPNKWIGRGPTPWSARSPDLTKLDLFLRCHITQLVYNETTAEHKTEQEWIAFGRINESMYVNKCESFNWFNL